MTGTQTGDTNGVERATEGIDRVYSSSRELELFATGAFKVIRNELDASDKTSVENVRPIPGKSRSKYRNFVMVCRSFIRNFPFPISCKLVGMPAAPSGYPSRGSRVTGTLFGIRKGHVHFAVQEDPGSDAILVLELATPTNTLVKQMASGLVRIALECERVADRGNLFQEPMWIMYCNGRKTGYAIRRVPSDTDRQTLTLLKAVSMGAGVLPTEEAGPDGELMYMRCKFERAVGSRDSEAFYMMNADGSGGPELSIFLLRI